jgi:aspartyl-tRNA(Asn)/glutamyl-tRNA(Gln) amidotransferase subunit B
MNILREKYQTVIGLEVHAQLQTKTKIFCGCSNEFGALPNTNICPVCMGHPGVLPVLNRKAVEFILKMGLSVNCTINKNTYFARKNYFYPDLPKGYQISQFDKPFCENGYIDIKTEAGADKRIRIKRIHLEEDAGKLLHDFGGSSMVDLNRCGVPLIEIVTEPDLSSPSEAYSFLSKIKQIVKYLNICDGNMEEGSLRCDANVSVKLPETTELGTKTEVKNMNSFRNVERAIAYEVERQLDIIEDGGSIVQETLLWDADKGTARSMRSKEEAHDYRYFPEPDLVNINISQKELEEIKELLPELPEVKKFKFINQYNLPEYDAELLTAERDIAEYYEEVIRHTLERKAASNFIMGEILGYLNETKTWISEFPITAKEIAELINYTSSGRISNKIAKEIFPVMIRERKSASDIIREKNMEQISDPQVIGNMIEEILSVSQKEIDEYISGKDKVVGYFIGRIMKTTNGKANPSLVNNMLIEKLESLKFNKRQE